jgi:hypothetical protein
MRANAKRASQTAGKSAKSGKSARRIDPPAGVIAANYAGLVIDRNGVVATFEAGDKRVTWRLAKQEARERRLDDLAITAEPQEYTVELRADSPTGGVIERAVTYLRGKRVFFRATSET